MNNGPLIVSIIVAVGFTMAINVMMFMKIDFSAASGQAFLIMVGVLAQSFAMVVSYWLGGAKPAPLDKP